MILPLYADNADRRHAPVVNYLLIIANVVVFVFLQDMGNEENHFTRAFALVPDEIVTGKDLVTPDRDVVNPYTGRTYRVPGLEPTPISVYLTLLTSIFMHSGWAHLLGNMLFLWIFGGGLEDRLGLLRYLAFYLVCGILSGLAHVGVTVALAHDTTVPCLGASGAISGVLGGFILLFPTRRVTVLIFRIITQVPAFVAIGLWFLFQLIHGLGALGDSGGGVAYGAHVGGFLAGLALITPFTLGQEPPDRDAGPWQQRRPWRPRRPGGDEW